jgi:hypothetical protein
MASVQARSGSSNVSHRTNSLAFAEHDCHTCATFKTECDRQRPRCGTCLSSRRKCDGFAMPLIWKDLEVAHNSPRHGDTRIGQSRKREPQRDAEFKFIRGRPKKKRKPKVDVLGGHQGCFPMEMVRSGTNLSDSFSTSSDSNQPETNTSYEEIDNAYGMLPYFACC